MVIIPSVSPGFVVRQNARLAGLFEHALERAVKATKGEKFDWVESEFELNPTAERIEAVLGSMAGKAVAFDVETDGGHPLENQLRCVGFYDGKVGIYVPLLYRPGDREDVPVQDPRTGKIELENRAVWKPAFKGKAELKVLKAMKALLEPGPKAARVLYTQNGQYDRMVMRARLGVVAPAGATGGTFDCYVDEETEFLTGRGWRAYKDVTSEDVLGAIDAHGRMRWERYTARVHQAYAGDVFVVETHDTRCVVTPNHRMWVSRLTRAANGALKNQQAWGFTRADELFNGSPDVFLARTAALPEANGRTVTIPEGVGAWSSPEAFWRFVGLFIADGTRGTDNGAIICQKVDGRAESLLRELSEESTFVSNHVYEHTESWRSTPIWERRWRFSAPGLREWLSRVGSNSPVRHLPPEALTLPAGCRKALLDGLLAGDASEVGLRTLYRSFSRRLADEVQGLALSLGYPCTMQQSGKCWVAAIGMGIAPQRVLRAREKQSAVRGNMSREAYSGHIVCFSVPSQTLITRSRGKPAFHGNTMVAHHVLAPFLGHDLGLLAALYTNAPFYKKTSSGGWAASTDHDLALYNLRDVKTTWLSAEQMSKELLSEYGQANAIYRHDMWQEQECENWKRTGFELDQPTLKLFRHVYSSRRDKALAAMRKVLGEIGIVSEDENFKALLAKLAEKADVEDLDADGSGKAVEFFNPGSLNQLRQMLAGLKIPLEEVTASGALSTAKEILTGARKELLLDGVPPSDPRIAFLDYLFAWRESAKVVGTYLYPVVLKDGRVHPSFSVHVVPTGRLSSSGPNFQNQPADIRGMFVARQQHTIVSMDWDALEMRLGAFLSGDPRYIEVFKQYDAKTGPKPHHANMAAIFGLEPTKKAAEANPGMYRAAKVFAYAVAYGAGDDTVYEQVREELPDMKWDDFIAALARYKAAYPTLFNFMADIVRRGTKYGFLESALMGRRVYFFERSWSGTSPEATAMQNMPFQSGGADIVGQANRRAMDRLVIPWRKKLLKRGDKWKDKEGVTHVCFVDEVIEQLAQVHDELVFEVPLRIADEFCAELKRISEERPVRHDGTVMDWNLPVDIHHGRRWKPVQTRCTCRALVDIELTAPGKGLKPDRWEGDCADCKSHRVIEVPLAA